jgi:hypothetical protein
VKFVAVLAGGVAGSFGLAALASQFGPLARIVGSVPKAEQRPSERPSEPLVSRPAASPR